MGRYPGAKTPAARRAEKETDRITRLLRTLRDPNEPTCQRLLALSQLDGLRALTPHERESVAINKAQLGRLVAEAGNVEAGPEVWFVVPADGSLRSRMR